MKSLNRRFAEHEEKRPLHSTIINFAAAVKGGRFTKRVVSYWFNRLVDEDDFAESDRRDILKWLNELSGAEDGRKKVRITPTTAPKSATPVSLLTLIPYDETAGK